MRLWRQQGQRWEMRRLHNVAATYLRDAQQFVSPILSSRCFQSTYKTGASSSPRAVPSEREEETPPEPVDSDENLSRLRELLGEVSPKDSAALFFKTHLPLREEVWPNLICTAPPTPKAPLPSAASSAVAATTLTPQYNSVAAINNIQEQQQQQTRAKAVHSPQHRDPLRWYGGPPGVIRDVDYFTATMAAQFNDFFRTQYYMQKRPTAPLLRCPACAAQLLAVEEQGAEKISGLRSSYLRTPTSSRLWMDPPALDRHLSWAHPDQLYTPQELAAYNDQVHRELLYSCGLAAAVRSACGVDRNNTAEPLDEWKTTPARLILAVDVANVEMGASATVLDMLTSSELCRIFAQVPVAICATHELFVPFASKILHALYQLALLHPSSTLHPFAANTSLESGDVMMSAYVNEMMLASRTRAIPPVVLLTNDGQQRQVAKEMHGSAQRTLSPVGVVRFASPGLVSSFAEEMRAALTGSFWKV
ncbi:hypothetical protein ABB37_00904 [Leptomonas pyrrhocoris]|uniref:Uncharacterized protein n=1 Tax=Leptomonas pyrrhocoris TaxID=157538 RepID=A0A0M9GBM4_LEPPY|nr:hypothetical protein ABB37_00904 [Leptomonas pyrrhocoris]XP_015665295.1 hypothetical protein ABB37_00904 [Leptomonas pyrrhocoris]KPA86855.1 hypothetical protein ABB37_00904 [Leptomonas pyrrhocoris]KPA86856.1 hypothetical protein ABB37_00904 [Leptomonas pyrrhocoris]|eukprot:XP_015665294.1 hypothetical protein ABB37_00904 [Leptomonas pyrrhocoris]